MGTVQATYTPERGDIVWLTLNPQVGREQAGRRPALVLSPRSYNGKVGLAIVCPITSQVKGYAFEVAIPEGLAVSGVVLADHIRSVDWQGRGAEFICSLPEGSVEEVLSKLQVLL